MERMEFHGADSQAPGRSLICLYRQTTCTSFKRRFRHDLTARARTARALPIHAAAFLNDFLKETRHVRQQVPRSPDPQNSQIIFIDQQPQMAFGVQSIDARR